MHWLRRIFNRPSHRSGPRLVVPPESPTGRVMPRLEENLRRLEPYLNEAADSVVRRFQIAGQIDAALVFYSSLTSRTIIDRDILGPLTRLSQHGRGAFPAVESTVASNRVVKVADLGDVLSQLLDGQSALFVAGHDHAYLLETPGFEYRSIEETKNEPSVRGSREGFVEVLDVNIGMIRRRLKDYRLSIRKLNIGARTQTATAVLWLDGVAQPEFYETVTSRLQAIQTDGIIESADLEEYIKDRPYSVFPTTRATSRPDWVVRMLLEGRVVVMPDNTPFALVLPASFIDFLRTQADYVHGVWEATFIRLLRTVALIIAPLFPGLYVSLTSVHIGLLPTEFALSIAGTREGIPFPAVLEVIMMEIMMEIIREGALRMPRELGNTIGIVGGLVLGQAAIQAGIVSPLLIIVIAATALATFTPPSFEIVVALRITRWAFFIGAAILGLYGMMAVFFVLVMHMSSLTSLGVPYMSPISPFRHSDWRDIFLRLPLPMRGRRPAYVRAADQVSQAKYQQPHKGPQTTDED